MYSNRKIRIGEEKSESTSTIFYKIIVGMQQIYRVEPNKIRNSEFQTLYLSVVRIVGTFDVEALRLSEMFRQMQESLPLLDELNEKDLKEPLTETLKDFRKRRNELASYLLMHTKTEMKSDDPIRIEAAETLYPFVERDLRNLSHKSYNAQLAFVNQWIEQVEADETLIQSLTILGMNDVFAKLKALQENITHTHDSRINILAKKKKSNAAKTKRRLYRVMTYLFTAIEAAALSFRELDYEPLIHMLNTEIERQRITYLQRQSRSTKEKNSQSTPFQSLAMVNSI
jgi:hypothetical protein